MIYFSGGGITVRELTDTDADIICAGEIAQGWDQSIDKYLKRLADFRAGKCISLAAEYGGNVAGYLNIYPDSKWGAFANMGYPELVDLGVLEKYRRLRIATRLMDAAEDIAREYADTVYLGVGLHSGYGPAQAMYVKRGYVFDGSGVWYGDRPAEPYKSYRNDDELNLYLYKRF